MKLRFTFTVMGLMFAMFLFMSNSGGRAAAAGAANTGAPGDAANTCGMCHIGGSFGTSIIIDVVDATGNSVTEYVPGTTYTVSATVNTTTAPQGYGLQLVSLIDATEGDTGGLANQSSNAQITSLGGRNYLEQAGLSSSEVFSADWTAPAEMSGSVTFYAAGHAANGNGASGGDESSTATFTIDEETTSAIDNIENLSLSIAPNPTQDLAILSLDQSINGTIEMFDIAGKRIFTATITSDSYTMDLSAQQAGVYFVKVTDMENNVFQSRRIIKK